MRHEEDREFGVGKWWTAEGRPAVVDAAAEGFLVGRIDVASSPESAPVWYAAMWALDGRYINGDYRNNLRSERLLKVKRSFWLNVYADGPGLLRNTWEESLIEASREEKQPLCRVEVKVDSYVGEGLK